MFHLDWPWILILLPLPLCIYRWAKPADLQAAPIVVPFYEQLRQQQTQTGDTRLWRIALLSLLWLLFVVAAARPQWAGEPVQQTLSGRDLLLAVDISDSMNQEDMVLNNQTVTRLQSVKQVVSRFIQQRQGDRIGLVLFGSQAYLQVPLTFDTQSVAEFLRDTQLGFAGPKTAIGDAIGLSSKRLHALQEASPAAERVIILLTDGANTAGEIEPTAAATLAKQLGIVIYTIGIGADEMVVRGLFGPRRVNPSAQLDEQALLAIAKATGGRYFRARNTDELSAIYAAIDTLEPIDQEEQWHRPTRSLFMWPLGLATLLSLLWIISYLGLGVYRHSLQNRSQKPTHKKTNSLWRC
ncbi:MAG: VWA domain-containing protein [Cellvibrionaceae bacterium]|nr:VWA domain-containing protein [Cellvibrionaceae bacterium]